MGPRGSRGWAQQLAAGVPRSVSLGKERRPLNRPAFQRPCRSGKCQEPAADEQRWGRPLGLGHLRQRRSERPRGRPRGRRPPTRVRAEWTQTGCVRADRPAFLLAVTTSLGGLPGDAVTSLEVLGLVETLPRAAA